MSSVPGRRFRELDPDFLLVGLLLVVAAAVRLPYLQLVPLVTDEAFEVLAALPILEGEWLLYGPVNPTAGPLVTYLLAAGFWLFGPGAYLPRALFLILGVLAAGATYLLGRSMGGRVAGVIAGLLLALSPIHTIVNSHVAWSNSSTPLFMTLSFAALHSAIRREAGWLLVLGGFLYGLGLQTHVSMLVAAPGLVVWFLARRDVLAWLRRPWPYLAAGAAFLGYGNMIAYNILTRGGGLADFQQHDYAWVSSPSWASYWANLKTMIGTTSATLGGQVPRIDVPLEGLVTVGFLAWLVVALVYTLWRGETMPVAVILSTALIMPYVNKRYEGLLSQRYIAFLLPLCFAAMGVAAARLLDLLFQTRRSAARIAALGVAVLMLFLAVYPLRATFAHYAVETEAGRDNRSTLAMTEYLEDAPPPGTALYLSANLKRGEGGYRYLRSLYYYLTLEGVEHWVLDFPDLVAWLEDDPAQDAWLLLSADDYETLRQEFALEPISGGPPIANDGVLARYVPPGR